MRITLKSQRELEQMRASGRVVQRALQRAQEQIRVGMTTLELDQIVYDCYTSAGARGLFKNYPSYQPGTGFPGNTCISVNEEVVHGIPSKRVLKDGDIVSVDCGVSLGNYCGDSAVTILLGNVAEKTRKMCAVTQGTLDLAIREIRPGRRWSDIARLMQDFVESQGFAVVQDFVGHGIGQQMHEDPKVPNCVTKDFLRRGDFYLQAGMTLAIEPMVIVGAAEVQILTDGWTVVSRDGTPAAHYEHTVAVTATGADVLTDGR
ncbi:MAG: type I methionyl aminopeptidase [Phycisphaerae bacterium]